MGDRPGAAARVRERARRLPAPARGLLAVLLLAMAAGQLSDVAGFARVLDGYRLLPHWWLSPAAWSLAAAAAIKTLFSYFVGMYRGHLYERHPRTRGDKAVVEAQPETEDRLRPRLEARSHPQ